MMMGLPEVGLTELLAWRRRIERGIDLRLSALVRTPELFGPPEAVELQLVQLLQVRTATTLDQPDDLAQHDVTDALVEFTRRRFPGSPPVLLCQVLQRYEQLDKLGEHLDDFCREYLFRLRLKAQGHDVDALPPLTDLHDRARLVAIQQD